MAHGKKFYFIILYLFILSGITVSVFAGKTVYVISNTTISELQTYKIDGTNLVYRPEADYICESDPYGEPGAVTLAIDESQHGDFLFVTFENSDEIELVDAKDMQYIGSVTAPGASNLAGIAIDSGKSKLYAVDRYRNHLYSYSWNPSDKTLTLDFDDPYYTLLEDLEWNGYSIGAFGIALDEDNGFLYVADNTDSIKYYDTNDWAKVDEVSVPCDAISIAIDVNNQFLYIGSIGGYGQQDPCLYQYDISSQTVNSAVVGCSVAGIAVDQDTSLIYLTTFGEGYDWYYPNPPEDRLMVYDSDLNRLWYSDDIGNPAGVVVSSGLGYKLPVFSIVKDNNYPDNGCISPLLHDNYLVYDIHWDANGFVDTDVAVIDVLPKEVNVPPNFISDNGEYDPDTHSVKWIIGDVTGNDSGTYHIQVAVNKWARPGCTITNKVKMEGDHYLTWYILDTNVCPWGPPIIYVDKDANGYENGTNWIDAYTDLQDALKAARNIGPDVNAIWVAQGIYKPVNDIFVDNYQDYNFALLEGVGLFGHFGGIGTYETSTSQRNFTDENNETVLEGLIYHDDIYNKDYSVYKVVTAVDIENAVLDGFTVRNGRGGGYVDGAGVSLDSSDISIVNCKFLDNFNGSGVEVLDYSLPYIHNCVFVNNAWSGIKVSDNSCLTVTSCSLDGNYYSNNYGILIYGDSKAVVEKTKFTYHQVNGAYVSYGDLTMTDCNFVNDISDSVYLSDSNATITYCSIKGCQNDNGIYSERSNLTVDHTLISDCYDDALFATDSNLTLTNSILSYSGECGIALNDVSPATIKNNWIHNNGTYEFASYRAGILLQNQTSAPLIRNNTIVDNGEYGIYRDGGAAQSITNCIVWNAGADDLLNCTATYSCIKNPDDAGGEGNISGDANNPLFYNSSNDDYHLTGDSPCIDTGNGNYSETDFDGEDRVMDGDYNGTAVIDMGADEYYWPRADYDRDEIVNFIDYSEFANNWLDVNEDINLVDGPIVDVCDLTLFCQDWLWHAPWGSGFSPLGMGMGGDGGGDMFLSEPVSPRTCAGGLMLSDISESLNAMPDSLYSKVEKFYAVKPYAQPDTAPQASLEEILEWIDELWESGVMKEAGTTYAEYIEFREAIKESASQ